ncbi:hypothetical protein [Nonomuraea guangzhouensis]|uniref:Transposase n=1 Tax=Nonomuraea guangzhouensis TaxID=1291555 RepID=A0ABW4GC67_9ACTN|nr:hypothetical protein [Nonomuraea guangzhouensis]
MPAAGPEAGKVTGRRHYNSGSWHSTWAVVGVPSGSRAWKEQGNQARWGGPPLTEMSAWRGPRKPEVVLPSACMTVARSIAAVVLPMAAPVADEAGMSNRFD